MNLVQVLKSLVTDQTVTLPGGVRNWFGAAARRQLDAIALGDEGSWLMVEVPEVVETLNDFWNALPYASIVPQRISTVTGAVTVPPGAPRSVLLIGACAATASTIVPLQVSGPNTGDVLTWYAGAQRVPLVIGAVNYVTVVPGTSTVAVLLSGTGGQTLNFPETFAIQGTVAPPAAPQWQSLRSRHADPVTGVSAVALRWFTEPDVGTYAVFRRQYTRIATLIGLTINQQRQVVATIDTLGDVAVLPNEALFVGRTPLGRVVAVADDPTGALVVTLAGTGTGGVSTSMIGADVFTAPWGEVNRVQSLGQPSLEFVDVTLAYGQSAEYALQAAHRLDANKWSEFSFTRNAVAGDLDAPGPIELRLVTVINNRATVAYTTPSDLDYAGTRVYRRIRTPRTIVTATGTVVTATPAFTDADVGARIVLLDGAIAGTFRDIISVSSGAANIDEAWPDVVTAGTLTNTDQLSPIMTDKGLPDTQDQMSFLTQGYGEYLFCTFDMVENEQAPDDAVLFEYDIADDIGSGSSNIAYLVRIIGTLDDAIQVLITAVGIGSPTIPTISVTLTNTVVDGYAGPGPHILPYSGPAIPLRILRPTLRADAMAVFTFSIPGFGSTTYEMPIAQRDSTGRGRELIENPEWSLTRPHTAYALIDGPVVTTETLNPDGSALVGEVASMQVVPLADAENGTARVLHLIRFAVP